MKKIKTYDSFLNEQETDLDKHELVDIEKLKEYARAIEICCDGEYGSTYFNPSLNKVFVCLGDSSPFNSEDLPWIMRDAIMHSNQHGNETLKIEVENEAGPNTEEEEGWLVFEYTGNNNSYSSKSIGQFVPYKD